MGEFIEWGSIKVLTKTPSTAIIAPMLQREIYLKRLRPAYHDELIKVITGMRRSGKSILLRQIQNELLAQGIAPSRLLTFNFEDISLDKYIADPLLLHTHIKTRLTGTDKYYLFFDEIQLLPGFERIINSLRATSNVSIFITGSNSQLLAGELATLLSGRYLSLQLFPFCFREFLQFHQVAAADYRSAFDDYLQWGGLPFVASTTSREEKASYIQDLFNSIVLRDVVERHKIKNTLLLNRIIQYLLINLGHEFSANSISRFLKNEHADETSVDTIISYLAYLDEAMFTQKISRFDVHGKAVMKTLEKHYLADLAFMRLSKDKREAYRPGRLENVVCLELLARGQKVYTGKTKTGEIDFVSFDQDNLATYYQVASRLLDPATSEREFGAFDDVKDHYPKVVLSEDTFDYSRQGMRHYNLIDWLTREP